MEDLNKTQVVLLTLFITFVTSVTTGIVTVTLLQQAPPGVTQTINRVVERTIEKVTPVKTEVKETRVLVAQEDEIIKTVALAKPAIVRIVLLNGIASADNNSGDVASATSSSNLAGVILAETNPPLGKEVGTGFLISSDGLVVTAYSVIPDRDIKYGVYVEDKKYTAEVVAYNRSEGLAILKIDHDKTTKFFAPQFLSKPLRLGQTVIVLGRDLERYTVSVGLLSSLREATQSLSPSFKTTVKSDVTNIGGPLLNSEGIVIGLNLEVGNSVPIDIIKSQLESIASTSKLLN